ncbi:MAG: type II toxin-antitoxin system VapC family toxin [Promethearchaeota archaeon]
MAFIDSDLIIHALRPQKGKLNELARRVLKDLHSTEIVKMTAYNYAELLKGAFLSTKVARNLALIEEFCAEFEIVLPTMKSFQQYARISADLRVKGASIGDFDELIASIVVPTGDEFYTHNIAHFERIPLLSVKDWASL